MQHRPLTLLMHLMQRERERNSAFRQHRRQMPRAFVKVDALEIPPLGPPDRMDYRVYKLYWSFPEAGKNYPLSIAVNSDSPSFADWPNYLCSCFSHWLEDSEVFVNIDIIKFSIQYKGLQNLGRDDIVLPIEDEMIDLRQLKGKIKAKLGSNLVELDTVLNFVVKIKTIWADFRIKKLLEMRALLSKNNQLGTNQQLSIDQLDTNETLSNVQLGTDFEKLYIEKYFTDVTFVFDNGKEIKAHKLILMARSQVFQAMFQNDMLESKQNRVEINDMDPESFEKLIRYIYTGRMNVTSEDKVADIIVGADKYALTEFRDYCEAEVKKLMNVENVADCFIVSHLLNLDTLKRSTIEFILSKKQEVLKTDGYKNLIKNRADLLAELFEKS